MKKIIYRTVFLLLIFFLSSIIYLSTVGIKTNKLNNQISEKIQNINENLKIELKEINIVLDPFKLKFNAKTIGTDIIYKDKRIELEIVKSSISLKSLIYKDFSLVNLDVSTKSLEIKNLISFLKFFKNDTKLFFAEKLIKNGYIIANISLEFNKKGNIKDNYKINGFVKNGNIDILKKYNLVEIDFNFELDKKEISLNDIEVSINDKDVFFPVISIIKDTKNFLISGKINNKEILLDKEAISDLIDFKISDLSLKKVKFASETLFNFSIDKRLKFENLKVNSKIDLVNLELSNNLNLKHIFPKIKKDINIQNHEISLIYDKENLSIDGFGDLLLQDELDKINYKIIQNKKEIKFDAKYKILNNELKIDFLNYEKKKKSNLEITFKGNKIFNGNLFFKKLLFNEKNNYLDVTDLLITKENEIDSFNKIDLDYLDKDNLTNKIRILKSNEAYTLKGDSFNINKIIENSLENNDKKKFLFKNKFSLNIDIKKTYLDELNVINDLKGYLILLDNDIYDANLEAKFDNNDKITLTVKKNDDAKITTLFSGQAKPLVKRYKFIKGFDEGSLDFYSVNKNAQTTSTLKIYDFKLKKLPALTKILTLASLQGIADLLSGEGIRFNEFEMNYSNKGNLMTVDEIYSIGPAISILMSGYIEKDNLISLRGTLVPATTLNKTIGSIPFLGEILVGKKTGEGVFGVSFKIKGPPKKTVTTVNPIKTLTPRFITRTLKKIKKN